ncbi:hypothetical protein J4209_03250 [Candidatus Woesearchaeota archaeon]|nr:hypothetical protein [Candidatus Woesearchaeota archaeon]
MERKPNVFEKIFLIVGLFIIIISYAFVHRMVIEEGIFSWIAIQTLFLWLILVVLIILTAANENTKEELKIVIKNQLDEVKLLRKEWRYKR